MLAAITDILGYSATPTPTDHDHAADHRGSDRPLTGDRDYLADDLVSADETWGEW
jgi:hypothetical protein